MNDELIKQMVDRFLSWKLPKDFQPDAGISFKQPPAPHWWPTGTNLFTATQAEEMVRYMLEATDVQLSGGVRANHTVKEIENDK